MATKKASTAQPDIVTLAATYSFYDDAGTFHFWQEGQVVTDTADVAALIERQAPLKEQDNG